jgi:signal transduction histidine kinase
MTDEIHRLRTALRDLVALSAIPAAWVGREPSMIAAGLADVLTDALHLDFAFVRLCDPDGGAAVDVARGNAWKAFPEWLQRHLIAVGQGLRKEIISDVGGGMGPCRGLVIPIGVNADGGLVAVACERADFPTDTDQLLLSVAVNQQATRFQNARLIHERRRVEEKLRQAHAEEALHKAQLAALGGLVAGVSHEINTPVGTSLTVASSLARRCAAFADEIAAGLVRRSMLDEFADSCRDASNQLVANLQRAAELIQSFKQVAVDRSHADRRTFDLKLVTEQVVASVRPGLPKSRRDSIALDMLADITLNSYPGAYGQVLTNLIFNAITHGFSNGAGARVLIKARRLGSEQVEITFMDDGIGIPGDVQRHVFDPFFTTNRAQGSTGLGLYIVHNLVTQHLGGAITLVSAPGKGTTICMTLPLEARGHAEPAIMAGRIGR